MIPRNSKNLEKQYKFKNPKNTKMLLKTQKTQNAIKNPKIIKNLKIRLKTPKIIKNLKIIKNRIQTTSSGHLFIIFNLENLKI